ncbi:MULTISPECIES: hypothetical protein [unclassified Nostoc]|uniref:hypothetical protein n=1 Tax=unclassified Nostoc TaxID=2593658 RepID=UPI002AD4D56E|nr:hypothetical protein [Nostoc sp. DedQUE03]MDZ7976106.1 hypothetical protein [Nostoc sp. DedQUE03]MDZ8044082.1 hypothetical protein [Nostoc sp. DedQUE02]
MCTLFPNIYALIKLAFGVAELKYESRCRDVAVLRLYKDFGIMQNRFHTSIQQRPESGVAESRYEFGCRDVAVLRLYKDFEITQNYFSYRNQQRLTR